MYIYSHLKKTLAIFFQRRATFSQAKVKHQLNTIISKLNGCRYNSLR